MSENEREFRARGICQIESAIGLMEDFEKAFARKDWNIAIRHAHDAVELFIKGAVYIAGIKAEWGHDAEAIEQLKLIAESPGTEILCERENIPVALQAGCVDNPDIGHSLIICDNSMTFVKRLGDSQIPLWERKIPEHDGEPLIAIRFERAGGYVLVSRGATMLAVFNELSGACLLDKELALPPKLSKKGWDIMKKAAQSLAKDRGPAYYHEATFTKEKAIEARAKMFLVRSFIGLIANK